MSTIGDKMKRFIKLEIKPIQFGYVVRILEQSQVGYHFGSKWANYDFETPYLGLRSASHPAIRDDIFLVRGSEPEKDNTLLVILYDNELRYSHVLYTYPNGMRGNKEWCDLYVKNLKKAIKFYNRFASRWEWIQISAYWVYKTIERIKNR
jgi:hypothetical protein